MADITKCEGGVCPYKEKCLRYTARDSPFQSYFTEIPIRMANAIGSGASCKRQL